MGYLVALTAIIWVVVFGYVLFIVGRQRKLQQDIDTLRQLVGERSRPGTK